MNHTAFNPNPVAAGSQEPDCIILGTSALVADDDDPVRTLNTHILSCMGLNAYAAEDGPTALECYDHLQDETAVALLDINMPGMDGLELCRKLRDVAPDLPVVFVSGACPGDIQQRLEEVQPVTFLPKPYGLKQLQLAIRSAVCRTKCSQFRIDESCCNPAFVES